MFTLDLFLTRACNQTCYYCNVYNNTVFKNIIPEVDIDFLKYALSCFDFKFNVIIGGGEPGIVSNLDNVYKILKDTQRIQNIRLLSNGTCRINNYDWLKDVDYYEHLIKDINDTSLIKFFDLDIIPSYVHWKQVIVTTENVTNSILNNFDYFEKQGMFSNLFWYKTMNAKTHSAVKFKENLTLLYKKLNRENELYGFEENVLKRKLCGQYPYMVGIDFEIQKLSHCNANSIICDKKELTKENIDLCVKGKLFKYSDYCTKCYVYNNNLIGTLFGKR